MFPPRPKENIMRAILSQRDALKMPAHNAGLREKGMA